MMAKCLGSLLVAGGLLAFPAILTAAPEGEGVHVSYLGEESGVAVNWLSPMSSPVALRYGTEPAALDQRRDSAPVALDGEYVHQVRLTGLQAGTRYYYQIDSGASGVTSRVCSFRTAPAAGQPVTFAVLGDIQVKGHDASWRRAAHWLAGKKPDFCLSLGDQVDKGLQVDQWKGLFADGAALFESTVFMPLIGNHDEYGKTNGLALNPAPYFTLFTLPDNGCPGFSGQWYAFRSGSVSFSILAAYPIREGTVVDVRKVPEQTAWLEATLAGQPSKGWKMAAFHPPVFSTGPHGGDTRWLDELWGRIFERRHVSVVFNGHTHAFEITRPLRAGVPVGDGRGIVYYNGAGITFSSPATGSVLSYAHQQREREPLALIVSATPEKLVLSTWNMADNAVIHEETMVRGPAP